MDDEDSRAVERVLGGERAAFRELVERHQGKVFGLLGVLLPRSQDREDVAQEAFLAAWRALSSFDRGRGTFAAWVLTIARNRAFNLLRRRVPSSRSAEVLDQVASPTVPSDEEPGVLLDRALLDLGPEHRTVFLLAEIHGLSLAEVAEVESVPIGTVKSRLARAKERLMEAMRRTVEPTP